ncbi:MAG: hypothetical protein WCJ37_02185 [Syntrophus sp. (in: bacteria)]
MKSINRAALVWLICWLMLLTVGCATTNKANLSNDEARESSRVQVTSQGTVFRNVGFYMIPILGDFLFATDIVNGVLDVKSEHPPQNELERNMIPSWKCGKSKRR